MRELKTAKTNKDNLVMRADEAGSLRVTGISKPEPKPLENPVILDPASEEEKEQVHDLPENIEERDTVVEVKHLSKVYKLYNDNIARLKEAITKKPHHKDFYALKDISFDVKEGQCLGIIGKNGSGKSTLLKILTGVLSPTGGEYKIDGRIAALLELGAGFNPEYTGRENIYLNGQIMGFSRKEIDEKVDKIIEFASIGDHIDQPVKTYSSGMFVRLAFAISINVDPEILIVDEALSVGDAFFQLRCYKKFTELKRMGKTIIFVTHDLSSVIKYCDHAIVLNEGEIIDEGTAHEMVDVYKQILVEEEMLKGVEEIEKDALKEAVNLKCNLNISKDVLEYGTKQAEIIELEVLDSKGNVAPQIEKFEDLTIKFKVKFNEVIKDPIFALTFKDIKGTELTGTNTMYESLEGFTGLPGEVYEVEFKQKMLFQSGTYFVSLGCTGIDLQNGLKVFHRLYDVVEVTVLSSKQDTVGYFDPDAYVSLGKIDQETGKLIDKRSNKDGENQLPVL